MSKCLEFCLIIVLFFNSSDYEMFVIKNTEFLKVDQPISKLTKQQMEYFHKKIIFKLHSYGLKKVDENPESDVEDPFI